MAAVAAAMLTGCTDSPRSHDTVPTASASGPAPSFHATIDQSRPQEGTRQINAQLTNTSDAPVTVTSVQISSTSFTDVPPVPKQTTFAPGQTIDLSTRFGDPVCGPPGEEPVVTVTLSDGSTQTLHVDRAGQGWLGRLHDHACDLHAVDAIAPVRYGPTFTIDRSAPQWVLDAELVLRRPAGSDDSTTLTVRSLEGSVLITLGPRPGFRLPATLQPGRRELRIPIAFGSFRCDQHALAASTQTFLLSAYVIGTEIPQVRVILIPDKHVQQQVFTVIDHNCHTG